MKTAISLGVMCWLLLASGSALASSCGSADTSSTVYDAPPAMYYVLPTAEPAAVPSIDDGTDIENIEDAEELLDELEDAQ